MRAVVSLNSVRTHLVAPGNDVYGLAYRSGFDRTLGMGALAGNQFTRIAVAERAQTLLSDAERS